MKLKLSVLVSSIATMSLVLALALSQSSTNPTSSIYELTATEMAAITGTQTYICKNPAEYPPSGINARWINNAWTEVFDLCNTGMACDNDDSPCGTDYYFFPVDWRCRGGVITSDEPCQERDTDEPLFVTHNCYCHDLPDGDKCEDDTKDDSRKAKEAFIVPQGTPNAFCDGEGVLGGTAS